MKSMSVSADTTNFVLNIGKKLWIGSRLFQNGDFFVHAANGLATGADGVVLPNDAAGDSIPLGF